MRKTICLFLSCSALFYFSSQAQKIKIGLNAGISIPELKSSGSNEVSQGYKSKLASVFGAFADFVIVKNFSIKTFINYAGQGGVRKGMQPVTDVPPALASMFPPGTTLYANFRNESDLNYLEIPVMAKWEWGHAWRYYADFGPYIGFLLSAKQKTSGDSPFYLDKNGTQPVTPSESFDANTDVKSSLNKVNFGFTGGVGISNKITKKSEIVLDIRGAYGLTTIQKDTQNDGKSHTGGLFITLGYAISLKH